MGKKYKLNHKKQRDLGFTLIELLVVVAILGLLASILLVALNNARIRSRDTKRVADFSQISKALDIYYDKHDQYPNIHNCTNTNPSPPPPCFEEDANQNWDDLITLLRTEKIIAESDFMNYKNLGLVNTAQAAASINDPTYPAKKYQYMVSVNPLNQSYRLRAVLEDINSSNFKTSLKGTFLYYDEPEGDNACDSALGFYCVGPTGGYDTYMPGKPVVYLYPTITQEVTVKVFAKKIEESIPEYGNGWRVIASPNGSLFNIADGKTYSSLFWEGSSKQFEIDKTKGSVVPAGELEGFIYNSLIAQGLNEKETSEFMEYWVPRMQGKPYVFVHFMPQADYDKLIPIEVNPKPDTVIRVYMLFRGLDYVIPTEPQVFKAPQRKGFTVVEWGGDRRQIR